MILTSLDVEPRAFEAHTGWALKPVGACKGEMCVPLGGSTDIGLIAERLGMGLVHDERAGVWALGPETIGGRALTTAEAPDLALPGWKGDGFELRSLRGQKVFLLAWASW